MKMKPNQIHKNKSRRNRKKFLKSKENLKSEQELLLQVATCAAPSAIMFLSLLVLIDDSMCLCKHVQMHACKTCDSGFLLYIQGQQCNVIPDTLDDIMTDIGHEEKKEGVVYAKTNTQKIIYALVLRLTSHLSPDEP